MKIVTEYNEIKSNPKSRLLGCHYKLVKPNFQALLLELNLYFFSALDG